VVVEHRRRQLDAPAHALGQLGVVQDVREVDAARLPVVDRAVDLEQAGAAMSWSIVRTLSVADPGALLGHEEEEVHDVLGGPLEALAPQGPGWRCDRRVEVAGAHHDAACRDERPVEANSSAPRHAAIATSRPVFSCPSVRR
jgi:hypothetical protein